MATHQPSQTQLLELFARDKAVVLVDLRPRRLLQLFGQRVLKPHRHHVRMSQTKPGIETHITHPTAVSGFGGEQTRNEAHFGDGPSAGTK